MLPVPLSQVLSLNPVTSTTSVSPSQRATESPIQVGTRSLGCCSLSFMGIMRKAWNDSYVITISLGVCTISSGIGIEVMRGTPGSRQRSVGSSEDVNVLLLASAQD